MLIKICVDDQNVTVGTTLVSQGFFFSSISALNIYSDIVCFMCVHVFLICWTSYFILKCDVGQHEAGGLEMENHYGHH